MPILGLSIPFLQENNIVIATIDKSLKYFITIDEFIKNLDLVFY